MVPRRVLGDYVPHIAKIDDATLTEANIYPYVMSVIPGITWLRARNRIANVDVTACKSLGRILALGSFGLNSAAVVDDFVKPKLRALLGCEDKLVAPYRALIDKMHDKADNLKGLPLFVAHADLNHVNIHVDDNGEVTGIVDWEGACRLPFGMGFSRIPHLAGGFRNGKFYVPKTFEEAERGLWSELISELPSKVSDIVASKMEVVQMSLTIGTLLEDLDSEHGRSDIILSNLPMLLKYRIPAIRGEELAFE